MRKVFRRNPVSHKLPKYSSAVDINTSAIFLDPPPELVGKVNVTPEMNDVLALATMYMGGQPCSEDAELMKKVRDKLMEAKPKWLSMDYGSDAAILNMVVHAREAHGRFDVLRERGALGLGQARVRRARHSSARRAARAGEFTRRM